MIKDVKSSLKELCLSPWYSDKQPNPQSYNVDFLKKTTTMKTTKSI